MKTTRSESGDGATYCGNRGLWEGWAASEDRQVPSRPASGAGGRGQSGHLRVEDTGPHTKGCESTNRGDSGNSALNTRPDQDRAQGGPRTASREPPDSQPGGRARPGPAHHRPAGLTPGPGGPGSDMLVVCEMK